jgi:hypothetical protein
LDQIAVDVSSSVILVVIIKYMSVSEPSGLPSLSSQPAYTYAQVKRAGKAKLAGSKRAKNQGPCQAQEWSVERKGNLGYWRISWHGVQLGETSVSQQ